MKNRLLFVLIVLFLIAFPYICKADDSRYFYDVLKNASEEGRIAKKYSGIHRDSFKMNRGFDVYHWYASDNTTSEEVLSNNNVIFGNYCWQILRTTDFGGVKLIYNGIPQDGKCRDDRPTTTGFEYPSTYSLAPNYYYGSNYEYNGSSYKLSGEIFSSEFTPDTVDNLVGNYTCMSTSANQICSNMYLVGEYYNDTYVTLLKIKPGSGHYSSIGSSPGTNFEFSPSAVGYMYNTKYNLYNTYNSFLKTGYYLERVTASSSDPWTFGDSYYCNSSGCYLSNTYSVQRNNFKDYVGKYTTARISSPNYVWYVLSATSNQVVAIKIDKNNYSKIFNYKFSYSDSYSQDSNGIVTLNNPITFTVADFINYKNDMLNKYVCEGYDLSLCNSVRYVSSVTDYSYIYTEGGPLLFNSTFVYNNGKYDISTNPVIIKNIDDSSEREKASLAHYTCFNSTGICDQLYYLYYYDGTSAIRSVLLSNGESIEDAFEKMFRVDDVNKHNSLYKTVADSWFANNMVDYIDSIEKDIVFCNDRDITYNKPFTNSSNSILNNDVVLKFKKWDSNNTDDLTCSNDLDKFNVYNEKAKLKYPVGLPEYYDLKLLGADRVRATGNNYYTLTPVEYAVWSRTYTYGRVIYTNESGELNRTWLEYATGIRPVIALKKGATYSSGDGSKDNPYIFDKIYNKIEIVSDETRGEVNVDVEDIRYVDDSTVVFKVMPKNKNTIPKVEVFDIDGNKLSTINTGNTNEYKVDLNGSDITIKVNYNQVINIPNTLKNIGTILLIFIPIIYISIMIINRNKNTDLNRM